MRFAVISNIRGNATALKAVFDDIDALAQPVEQVLCAGDIVGVGPEPNEAIDLLRQRGVDAVLGNYDDAIVYDRIGSGSDFGEQEAENADYTAIQWTRATLTSENLEFLRGLPKSVRVSPAVRGVEVKARDANELAAEYRRTFVQRALGGAMFARPARTLGKRVTLTHGTHRALNEFVRPGTANSILGSIASNADSDVLITAHAGISFKRDAHDVTFVGVGSVDGSPEAATVAEYIVLSIGEAVEIEINQVPYDPAPQIRSLEESGLPRSFALRYLAASP